MKYEKEIWITMYEIINRYGRNSDMVDRKNLENMAANQKQQLGRQPKSLSMGPKRGR